MADISLTDASASGIYQIRNLVNGKRYIGSAKIFRVRWAKHCHDLRNQRHHSRFLQRSWRIYGPDAFQFEVLEFCSGDELIQREQFWIDSINPEYNVCPIAGSSQGRKTSIATKRKLAKAMTGRYVSEETRHRQSLSLSGRTGEKWSLARRAASSLARKGRKKPVRSPEHQEKITSVKRKLTPDIALKIRARVGLGETQASIAREFNVSGALICMVMSKKRYA